MARSTQWRWTSRGDQDQRGGQCRAPGLRQAREAAGMTREELAELAGYGVEIVGPPGPPEQG